MSKFIEFIKKPKNIYFSIVAMLTLVTGLASISFSYVDETNTAGVLKLSEVDNRIDCGNIDNCIVFLNPHETIDVPVYVISNNDYDSAFVLYSKSDKDALFMSSYRIDEQILSKSMIKYNLKASNFSDEEATLELKIKSAKNINDITVDGDLIHIIE